MISTTKKCQHFLVTSELVLLQVVNAQIRKSISKVYYRCLALTRNILLQYVCSYLVKTNTLPDLHITQYLLL